jgi:hypothetical protein
MMALITAGMIVVDTHSPACKVFRNISQMAEKLTVSRDNNLGLTPTSIEADMNS